MKKTLVFICLTCWALSALSLAEDTKKNEPPSSMAPASQFDNTTTTITTTKPTTTTMPTTTPKTTTPTTTKSTTTTTHSTTPTTTKSTTTTTPSTTPATTKSTTSTTPTTTPTTTKSTTTTTPSTTPNTTTTTMPTTTKPPTPTPPTNLTVGNYTVKKGSEICLMAQMALQIRLVSKEVNGAFNVLPSETKFSGSCSATTAHLMLTFKEGNITFRFNKSIADNTAYVDSLSFYLTYSFRAGKNGSPYIASNKSLHLFPAKIGHSYSCSNESIFVGSGLYLDVSKDRMQGFNITKNNFGSADPCPADAKDYTVAIAVGVTLLVLVIIVVVVYLLSRRRRTTGYQSL